jgi:hypothetical protein
LESIAQNKYTNLVRKNGLQQLVMIATTSNREHVCFLQMGVTSQVYSPDANGQWGAGRLPLGLSPLQGVLL